MSPFRRKHRKDRPATRSDALNRYLAAHPPTATHSPAADDGKQLRCAYCGQMTPTGDWPEWGDRVAFYNQTSERTETEPGAHRIEVRCRHCEKAFFVVWDRDPRPAGARPAPPAVPPMPPNDALRAISTRVEQLDADHPRAEGTAVDPRLGAQIPWICRTLEEAAAALETGFDPFDNAITDAQVAAGLRTMVGMVRAPSYLSLMESGRPGIASGLADCMDSLEEIIAGMEDRPAPSSSAGVETLVALCTELGILFPDEYVERAVASLQQEGPSGSRALADLIRELLAYRSAAIIHVLAAAARVDPVPELVDAVRAVTEASEITEAPAHPRFTPEIVGKGRCGWTTGTHQRVEDAARSVLRELERRD